MSDNIGSPGNRYLSSRFVDFWMADNSMEAGRSLLRHRLLSFLTLDPSKTVNVLDLGAGTGALSLELLNRFPNINLTCIDFSEAMLSHAKEKLNKYKPKVTFVQADLTIPGWSKNLARFDAVVSSFLTHTIPNSIEPLYSELFGKVNAGGYFLSCDIFPASGPILKMIYRKTRIKQYQKLIKAKTGIEKTPAEVDQFLNERHKRYRAFSEGDATTRAMSMPSLLDHLEYLRKAGFDEVDCLLKQSQNAIIGGFKDNDQN